VYRCRHCDKSMVLCRACRKTRTDLAQHDMCLDVRTEAQFRGQCVECEQPLSMRWYQPEDRREGHIFKVCESCAGANGDITIDDSGSSTYARMNEWEHVARPECLHAHKQGERCDTGTRLLQLAPETHQRAIDAFRILSLRPYFTRLWVSRHLLLQVREIFNSMYTHRSSRRSAKLAL